MSPLPIFFNDLRVRAYDEVAGMDMHTVKVIAIILVVFTALVGVGWIVSAQMKKRKKHHARAAGMARRGEVMKTRKNKGTKVAGRSGNWV
jgi:uncharacterized membrane protein YcjF (UPF0283 family)